MKKIILIIALLCAFAPGRAQNTFAPVGAAWWYYTEMFESDGMAGLAQTNFTFNTTSVKDTVINSVACRKVQTHKESKTNSSWATSTAYTQDFFFYDNGDTAFIYNENFGRFTPLYIFNAEDGDTVCLPVPPTPLGHADLRPNPISGDTSFCFMVDSVRIRLYDTAHLKTFYTHALTDSFHSGALTFPAYNWGPGVSYNNSPVKGQYIERIIGDFIPTRIIRCVDCWSYTYAPYGDLRCYDDSVYHIKISPSACDLLPDPPLGIEEGEDGDKNFLVYPNPSQGYFTFDAQQPFTKEAMVLITDISGRKLKQVNIAAGKSKIDLELSDLQAGIYFLILSTGEHGKYYQKIIIRR